MLTITQLEANKKIFDDSNEKYGIFTPKLKEFLGDDFYTAPATSSSNMIGCYPGGLLRYLIKACKFAIKVNEILPDSLKQPPETIVKVVFLSQIGKVFMFKVKVGNLSGARPYDFNNDIVRMHVGERSVYYALTHGVTLEENEYQAILNLDKDEEDKMAKYFSEPLTEIIRHGFDLAAMEEKNGTRQEKT
jgi:hypothetical protein